MKERILRQDPAAEFYTAEKCYVTELSNTPHDPGVSIARVRVAPGVTTRRHRLAGVSERYCILQGTGRMEAGSLAPRDVVPGDVVLIPPLCPQRIANTGREDLVFLAVCTPRFSEAAYEDIDDDPPERPAAPDPAG